MKLMESLTTTEPLAAIFSDESVVQAMLDFEAALARAEARHAIISKANANKITGSARASNFDVSALASAAARAGNPAIPMVQALTEEVQKTSGSAAGCVHWGSTSQDVCDTAMILLLRKAQPLIESDLHRVLSALRRLAERHEKTVMLGRTLLQPAPPITFGLKAAGWLGAIYRSEMRLQAAFAEALVLQFGGASGTLAALGSKGLAVAEALAKELRLPCPAAPWHSHRDRLAALLCAMGVLAGALGKMARDISLLMQDEVGETAEAHSGGSSTMPHKRNPVGCITALAAVARVPALISSFLTGMIQEHERAAGAWQAEWPTIAEVVQSTGRAAATMADVAENLIVQPTRMRENIDATLGAVFAERATMMMAPKLGRDAAYKLLQDALRASSEKKQSLGEALAESKEVREILSEDAVLDLKAPEHYLGVAKKFQERLLASSGKKRPAPAKKRG